MHGQTSSHRICALSQAQSRQLFSNQWIKFAIWVALKLKQCAVSMGIGPYAREEQYCQHAYQSQDRLADMVTPHSNAPKLPKTAPFRAQSAVSIIGDQPVKGLYGAHCSPERSRLLGNSRFSAKLTGTSRAA
ncbi:MAG: hypothetical protein ACK473_07705, partial [Sphingomonadales bacterium]